MGEGRGYERRKGGRGSKYRKSLAVLQIGAGGALTDLRRYLVC